MSPADQLRQRLKEIGERAERATPGPWKYYRDHMNLMVIERPDKSRVYVCGSLQHKEPESALLCMAEVDAKLAAHARTDIPAIISAMEKLLEGCEHFTQEDADGTVAIEAIAEAERILKEMEK